MQLCMQSCVQSSSRLCGHAVVQSGFSEIVWVCNLGLVGLGFSVRNKG